MSEVGTTYVGQNVRDFDRGRKYKAYTRTRVANSEDKKYISGGSEDGLILDTEIPWGTKAIADTMRPMISKFRYQPYSANAAQLEPAAELGDGVAVSGTYSGIYTRKLAFGTHTTADISAPLGEDLDHEYPYVPKQDRKVEHRLHGLSTTLSAADGEILQAVTNLRTDMNTELAVRDGKISAKVSSQTENYDTKSFGWSLTEDEWKILNNGDPVFQVDDKGAQIKGKITAISGQIGGFSIKEKFLTYNALSWSDTTKLTGIYLGVNGLKLGQNFKVEMDGTLTAKDGTFEGKITAKTGKIGAFDINTSSITTNGQTWDVANSKKEGIYIGSNGIRLGQNFKVSRSGKLTATDGEFTGTVKANKIEFDVDDDNTKLDGSALKTSTVGGTVFKPNTIGINKLATGIGTSLSYADFAHDVFSGYAMADDIETDIMRINKTLEFKGYKVGLESYEYKNEYGGTSYIYYLGWSTY